jgi:hypothetical protein
MVAATRQWGGRDSRGKLDHALDDLFDNVRRVQAAGKRLHPDSIADFWDDVRREPRSDAAGARERLSL